MVCSHIMHQELPSPKAASIGITAYGLFLLVAQVTKLNTMPHNRQHRSFAWLCSAWKLCLLLACKLEHLLRHAMAYLH